jgi:hypothetical protein
MNNKVRVFQEVKAELWVFARSDVSKVHSGIAQKQVANGLLQQVSNQLVNTCIIVNAEE